MNTSELLTPEQIVAYNDAFAQSLMTLNNLAYHQRQQTIDQAIFLMRATAELSEASVNWAKDESFQKAFADLKASNTADGAAAGNGDTAANDSQGFPQFNSGDGAGPKIGGDMAGKSVEDMSLSFYQSIIQALANAQQNAVANQQQANVTAQASITMGISTLYSVATASLSIASSKVLNTINGKDQAAKSLVEQ